MLAPTGGPAPRTVRLTTVPVDSTERFSILIVDDHPVVRGGLRALLAGEPWVSAISEAGSMAEARRLATERQPDVAVIDLGLPDGDGTELIRRLSAIAPGCAMVVLTMTNEPAGVQAALEAGARGYVLKDSAPDMLVGMLRTVAAGGRVLGPRVDTEAAAGPGAARASGPLDRLTPRERRILVMLGNGCGNAEIARELSLRDKTVRNQISMLITKLAVADRTQAVLLAQRAGLLD